MVSDGLPFISRIFALFSFLFSMATAFLAFMTITFFGFHDRRLSIHPAPLFSKVNTQCFPEHSRPEVLFHTLRDVAFDPLENDAVVIEFCMRLLPGIDVTYRFVTVCGFMRIFVYVCVRTFTYIFTDLDKAPVLHALPPKENVCPAFNGM